MTKFRKNKIWTFKKINCLFLGIVVFISTSLSFVFVISWILFTALDVFIAPKKTEKIEVVKPKIQEPAKYSNKNFGIKSKEERDRDAYTELQFKHEELYKKYKALLVENNKLKKLNQDEVLKQKN